MTENLLTFRRTTADTRDFDRVKISIADPEVIREWSYGEVKKSETINHRSGKPERDGLFCAHIFGPIKDYECLCGKYRKTKHRDLECEKCGVKVTLKKVRRERMGHIELHAPIVHPWFLKWSGFGIGAMLGMKQSQLKQIAYFERFVVIDPGPTKLKRLQLLTSEELEAAKEQYGEDEFEAGIGGEAIRQMLERLDEAQLGQEVAELGRRSDALKLELRRNKLLGRVARVLGAKPRELERLVGHRATVVIDPGLVSRLRTGNILSFERTGEVAERYAKRNATLGSGPSGLRDFYAKRMAEGKVTDEGLFEELLSVLRESLEQEQTWLGEDAQIYTEEVATLQLSEEALAQELGLKVQELHEVLAGERYIVLLAGRSGLEAGATLTAKQAAEHGVKGGLVTATGLVAVAGRIEKLNKKSKEVAAEWQQRHVERILRLGTDYGGRSRGEGVNELELRRRLSEVNKRRRFLSKFLASGNRPEWMVLTVLPVLPPDLRPLVQLDGGRQATSDLNELYRRVINRNNRLKRCMDQEAPDVLLRNEKRMLQRSVDALLANGKIGDASLDANKRPLKSFADMLFGKQGRFRQNLLGKRVDYSGRSVIVVGPDLKLHQCGLPKRMAMELFSPFIYAKLAAQGHSVTLKQSKRFVESELPIAWDALAEVMREHPVLLNRAPTLHRLGIQAFEPVLIEGNAIQLHPLVCAAFNADFDGDQMAVHVPLSIEAQLEARVLMMSTNNILSPADGKPVIVPSQDIVLGLYYLSLMLDKEPGDGMVFSGPAEAEHAFFAGRISLHSRIQVRIETYTEDGKPTVTRFETTLGRVRLFALLPKNNPAIRFDFVNHTMRKAEVRQLIDTVYRHCGQKQTVIFCDHLMELGFGEACRAGISVGMKDMVTPKDKAARVAEAEKIVDALAQQSRDHLITEADKYNRSVEAWTHCTDEIADAVVRETSIPLQDADGRQRPNPVYMMMHSGARGSKDQMKQIAGMRGLMSKPSGEIIDTPIVANFMEGLSVREYFYSTHGARKGLTDTALKTSRSGYFTRRLVYLAQGCVVDMEDCGTSKGIDLDLVVPGERHPLPFANRLLGRVVRSNVVDPESRKVIVRAGEMIEEDAAARIEELGVPRVEVRSPLTCESPRGVCAKCYGRDLARGSLVNQGETVGIVAAQSIGEPGTQLTMRTFHSGGAAAVAERASLESPVDGKFELRNARVVVDKSGQGMVVSRNSQLAIIDSLGREQAVERLPYGARILAGTVTKRGASGPVKKGERLVDWDPYNHQVIAECDGTIKFEDLTPNLTFREDTDEATGNLRRTVIDWTGGSADGRRAGITTPLSALKPSLTVTDAKGEVCKVSGIEARYLLSIGAIILVEDGAKVPAGTLLARVPRRSAISIDITGGLPRIEALFNVHEAKEDTKAIIASVDGKVRLGPVRGNNRKLIIDPTDPSQEPVEFNVPKGRYIAVAEGASIKRGDYLIDGDPAPQDILDVYGDEEGELQLARHLIDACHKVYRAQGVEINDKHIEVIVRQMLRKVMIVDPGDTGLLQDERIDRSRVAEINAEVEAEGRTPATVRPVVRRFFDESRRDTNSFIAEASFVETGRVLTQAAAEGEVDNLTGLKENVVLGRLIPAGTGLVHRDFSREAVRRDNEIVNQKRQLREAVQRKAEAARAAKAAFKPVPEADAEEVGADA